MVALGTQDPWTGGRQGSRGPFGERERIPQQARKGTRGCEILAVQTQCLPEVTAAGDVARTELLRRALMPASSTLVPPFLPGGPAPRGQDPGGPAKEV